MDASFFFHFSCAFLKIVLAILGDPAEEKKIFFNIAYSLGHDLAIEKINTLESQKNCKTSATAARRA
jgi:hypothetical protein